MNFKFGVDKFSFDPVFKSVSKVTDEIASTAANASGSFCHVTNPKLPYVGSLPNKACQGTSIVVRGVTNRNGDFAINLQCGSADTADIAFHFNVRASKRRVVRNSRVTGCWGREEFHGGYRFKANSMFELDFLISKKNIEVKLDHFKFCTFKHRLDLTTITTLSITGDVTIHYVGFHHTIQPTDTNPQSTGGQTQSPCGYPQSTGSQCQPAGGYPFTSGNQPYPAGAYPQPVGNPQQSASVYPSVQGNQPCPTGDYPQSTSGHLQYSGGYPQATGSHQYPEDAFSQQAGGQQTENLQIGDQQLPNQLMMSIPGGMIVGRTVSISGTPRMGYRRFTINLQCGQSTTEDIALHMDVRLHLQGHAHQVIRNSCINGGWGSEENHIPHFPFHPNVSFDVMILSEHDRFKVAVNNQHFLEFTHRLLPLDRINTINISGDVQLFKISFQ